MSADGPAKECYAMPHMSAAAHVRSGGTTSGTGRIGRRKPQSAAIAHAIAALDVLNDREKRIFQARRLADDPITLEDLASEFGVSRERVRQIEVRAFEKVQKAVKNRIATAEQPAGGFPVSAVAAPITLPPYSE